MSPKDKMPEIQVLCALLLKALAWASRQMDPKSILSQDKQDCFLYLFF